MSYLHQTAVITNANSRFGIWTIEALAASVQRFIAIVQPGDQTCRDHLSRLPNVEILTFDIEDENDWQAFAVSCAQAGRAVDLLVHAAPSSPADITRDRAVHAHITAPWLAAKYAFNLMRTRGRGIVVLQAARPQHMPAVMSCYDGEVEALRIANAALLQDASRMGVHLRLNRLLCDSTITESFFKAGIRLLQDDRSSFMAGAELTISGGSDPAPIAREDLAGKTVLVTGATSGIGRATAVEAGRLGAFVAVGGRKPDAGAETLALIRDAGGDGMFVPLDVTREKDWRTALKTILSARGELHGLVNNAGEARNRHIDELTVEDLDFLLSVNYRACLLGMTEGAKAMQECGAGGSIVNITSVAALRGGPSGAAYGASKAGALGLSREFARVIRGVTPTVRVNALQPGFIWSDSVADSLGEDGAQKFRAMIEPKTVLGRVGEPAEIARMVCFLLSDAGQGINGQAINVSGGLELGFP